MKICFAVLLLVAALRWPAGAQETPALEGAGGPVALLTKAIAGLCPSQCVPLETSGLGNFLWYYQDANHVFNAGTLNFISARVKPGTQQGTASLSAAGGYINAYAQVIAKLSYTLGSADQARMQATAAASAKAGETTVGVYQANFGTITQVDLDQARRACGKEAIQSSLDYVISYIMGSVWSGRGQAGLRPLTTAEMSASSDLPRLLPLMPPQGATVVAAASNYLSASQAVTGVWSAVQAASWEISRLNQNTGSPNNGNGGMTTVNPQTGAVSTSYQPGYRIPKPIADISRELHDPTRVLRVAISVPSPSDPTQGYLLEFSGYSYVPIEPASWRETTGDGWYGDVPVAQATANASLDVSGYKFVSPPGYNMGNLADGGSFGRLTGLLICRGMRATPIGKAAAGAGPPATAWTWTITGGQEGGYASQPLLQQAYVIAGTLAFPVAPASTDVSRYPERADSPGP